MPKSPGQKNKILYLMKLLLEQTDEMHPLTMPEILEEMVRYGVQAERKSVYADIEALQMFGIDIVYRRERPSGYYVGSREFELPELKLLVDAVQSSRFLTVKKSEQLIKKLESLASRHEARQLSRQVVVSNRIKTMNESIYYNVDKIHMALSGNVKILFQYGEWTVEREMRLKKAGAHYKISPWALTWDNENYYMIGFDEEAGKIKHYRVDKMRSITLSGETRTGQNHFKQLDMARYANKTFGMFGGMDEDIHLTVENHLAGVIIDRFGQELSMRPVDDGHFKVRVRVTVSPQFFGWLTGLGNGIEITGPDHVRDAYLNYINEIRKQYIR